MVDILIRDKVWVSTCTLDAFDVDRVKGSVVVVKPDGSECIVALENGINIRVPTRLLELRETHE